MFVLLSLPPDLKAPVPSLSNLRHHYSLNMNTFILLLFRFKIPFTRESCSTKRFPQQKKRQTQSKQQIQQQICKYVNSMTAVDILILGLSEQSWSGWF